MYPFLLPFVLILYNGGYRGLKTFHKTVFEPEGCKGPLSTACVFYRWKKIKRLKEGPFQAHFPRWLDWRLNIWVCSLTTTVAHLTSDFTAPDAHHTWYGHDSFALHEDVVIPLILKLNLNYRSGPNDFWGVEGRRDSTICLKCYDFWKLILFI